MRFMLCLLAVGLFAATASAAIPDAMQAKLVPDDELALVRGGATTLGGGTISITLPSVTITRPAVPVLTINKPTGPKFEITPLEVIRDGGITIKLPTITINKPSTPPIVITKPATPIVTFTAGSVVKSP